MTQLMALAVAAGIATIIVATRARLRERRIVRMQTDLERMLREWHARNGKVRK
jgi:hypothetical protein